jgi:hypothetical protein
MGSLVELRGPGETIMPYVTIVFGIILCFLGLHGYFGSPSENPSLTALIPFFFGDVLVVCGIIARNPRLRMHVMHFAVTVGLVGFLLAGGRAVMKLNEIASDDPTIHRAPRIIALMAIVCLVFVGLCVGSFISARRRRVQASTNTTSTP